MPINRHFPILPDQEASLAAQPRLLDFSRDRFASGLPLVTCGSDRAPFAARTPQSNLSLAIIASKWLNFEWDGDLLLSAKQAPEPIALLEAVLSKGAIALLESTIAALAKKF